MTSERTAPSWLYQVGSGDWRRKELMIGDIHRPQRITRTACSTRPSSPPALNRPLIGRRLRSSSAVSSAKLMLNSGAAIDQLMTPASNSAQNSRTPPATSPR